MKIFQTLALWASDTTGKKFLKATKSEHEYTLEEPKPHTFMQRISSLFSSSAHPSDQYKILNESLIHLHRIVQETPEGQLRDKQVATLKAIYARVAKEFESAKTDESVTGRIKASDLLEAYNTAFQREAVPLGIERIKASATPPDPGQAKKEEKAVRSTKKVLKQTSHNAILLADYRKLEKIQQRVAELQKQRKEEGKSPLTRGEVAILFEESQLQLEPAPMGQAIDFMYRHHFKGRLEVEKVITKIAEWKYGSQKVARNVLQTVSFFKGLHIDLWLDIGGELYSFSELFGYNLRDPKTYHESFTRDLTQKAKEALLRASGYRDLQATVREVTCDPSSQVVCANSFARTTVIHCKQGSIDDPRSIRGKVLSLPGHEGEAKEQKEMRDDYAQRSPFSIHELLGGFSPVEKRSKKQDDGGFAQASALGIMASMVQHHDTTMVIQRLAPADIHHYYATADAEVLSRAECCMVLREEIEQRTSELGEKPTEEDKAQLQQLEQLEKYFLSQDQNQEKKEGQKAGPSDATFNIAGSTLASVSTKAVRQEASILSTNDRKIMMVRHKDGSIAIHVFIGASAVNSVGVTAHEGEVEAGHDYGWMSFGMREKGDWIRAQTGDRAMPLPQRPTSPLERKAARSVRKFLSRGQKAILTQSKTEPRREKEPEDREISISVPKSKTEEQKPQEAQVGFALGGSTVISIYMRRDYRDIPQVSAFVEVGSREVKGKPPEEIEMRTRLGDPLATPLSYQTILLMNGLAAKKNLTLPDDPLQKLNKFKELLNELKEEELTANPLAREWHALLSKAKDAKTVAEWINSVSGDDRYILINLLTSFTLSFMDSSAKKQGRELPKDPLQKLQMFKDLLKETPKGLLESSPFLQYLQNVFETVGGAKTAQEWVGSVSPKDLPFVMNLLRSTIR
jgi:phosphatidylserine decarboxylase